VGGCGDVLCLTSTHFMLNIWAVNRSECRFVCWS